MGNRRRRGRLEIGAGIQDTEAFQVETFAGTAKRTSQRLLASEAATHPDWDLCSIDVNTAFLKGLTYKELAAATGEDERIVCFTLPPGSATLLHNFPGFAHFDESTHCLQCTKPGTGTKDAPRAFSLKLRQTTKDIGFISTHFGPEFEIKENLRTAKHVDDINLTRLPKEMQEYIKAVESVFGPCKRHNKCFTNCGVRHTKTDGAVILDQDEYIATLRPRTSNELIGAPPEREATPRVANMFVSLQGAIAYIVLTQDWIRVYVVSLQRVQQPRNFDVRRLNAITRKLQKNPQELRYPFMTRKRRLTHRLRIPTNDRRR